jgi:hypothetical protein
MTVSLGVLIYFAWKLYQEFGWAVFRMVGADPELKGMMVACAHHPMF